ncbi:hypothetical protein [Janthinobacterium agaricidamnosum]|uniref:Uncharacterized protein n=1 Tax=Janthinobacterium agaricidamnosum NBRC 102515 = DSM 9628 TaxID=1349767 RepID=W0V1D7_9BURK|nr:hypothetical protein [Janthinobacterium agaricidamnosum]CDG82639.1 hypothetical protein GJA_2003 [Janthinobacterium agaricidamnosum NBRC 102515 = DSM 9628]
MDLFKWPARRRGKLNAGAGAALGSSLVALRLEPGDPAPAGSLVVIFDDGGRARRSAAARIRRGADDTVYCYHPGPYCIDLTPFAAAPETGLRLHFAIDASDPRVTQQRFDLYLYCEAARQLALPDFGAALQAALQLELAQGNLELPPCTSLDEWHAFRAGLNQLFYTRFGITVDDCLPVDLGQQVDFTRLLALRVQAAAAPAPALAPLAGLSPAVAAAAVQPEPGDARSLRRLFLELPAACCTLRQVPLPVGQELFQAQRRLLQRLDLIYAGIGSMPSLAWAAPDQPLDARQRARRSHESAAAVRALDEAWALLARFQLAAIAQLPGLFDDADRILSNLEHHLAQRRLAFAPLETELDDERDERREPR